jgi:hypothetical protein
MLNEKVGVHFVYRPADISTALLFRSRSSTMVFWKEFALPNNGSTIQQSEWSRGGDPNQYWYWSSQNGRFSWGVCVSYFWRTTMNIPTEEAQAVSYRFLVDNFNLKRVLLSF